MLVQQATERASKYILLITHTSYPIFTNYVLPKENLTKQIPLSFRNDKVTNHNGDKCVWKADKGWIVEDKFNPDTTPMKCIKSIGYYQWIPYVLLIQVRSLNNFAVI